MTMPSEQPDTPAQETTSESSFLGGVQPAQQSAPSNGDSLPGTSTDLEGRHDNEMPWLWRNMGPAIPFASFMMFVVWIVRQIPAGVPILFVFIVGIIFFVTAGLAYMIFTALRGAYRRIRSKPERAERIRFSDLDPAEQASLILLWSILALSVFLLYSGASSLVFGVPVDWRNVVNLAGAGRPN
jgi:hypothetical protein